MPVPSGGHRMPRMHHAQLRHRPYVPRDAYRLAHHNHCQAIPASERMGLRPDSSGLNDTRRLRGLAHGEVLPDSGADTFSRQQGAPIMTTAQDQQEPLFLLPPQPTPQKPERKKLAPWHWAVLVVGVPVIAFLSCVGANSVAHWWIGDTSAAHASAVASHEPAPHKSKPPKPAYDLAGYQSALTGPHEHTFASALYALRTDDRTSDFAAAVTDAPRLINAANAWLTVLSKTSPPPAYQPSKLAYMQAVTVARNAARSTQAGLRTTNLALLQRGTAQANRARSMLSQAPALGPRGS